MVDEQMVSDLPIFPKTLISQNFLREIDVFGTMTLYRQSTFFHESFYVMWLKNSQKIPALQAMVDERNPMYGDGATPHLPSPSSERKVR
jgi:hypothetical protein